MPLLSLLGAFDLEATLLDPTVVGATPIWRYPTDYLPPLLLLVAQLLLFIFLLSAAGRAASPDEGGNQSDEVDNQPDEGYNQRWRSSHT